MIIAICTLTLARSQGNRVFAGGELINYAVLDIPASNGAKWSTERSANPGYFTAIGTASFTGCSNDAHINGYIKKTGNTSFAFPIGNGTKLRTLEISAPDYATDTYATAWIEGNPSGNNDPTGPFAGTHNINAVTAPLIGVSNVGQWDWQTGHLGALAPGSTGTGEGIFITVSIPDMTGFAAATSLRLAGWNGHSWIDLSGIPTATGNTENSTLKGIMVPGITAIAIGKIRSGKPFRISSIQAVPASCKTLLKWTTSEEYGTGLFVVEQSINGGAFTAVASVQAAGLANGSNYNTMVAQPAGTAYYRIRMTDENGAYYYSDVVSSQVRCRKIEFIKVSPNPVSRYNATITVDFTTTYGGKATLSVINAMGGVSLTKTIDCSPGSNQSAISLSGLASGTYFIVISQPGESSVSNSQKIILQ
ncbi:MAG: T9SS type A sorting domain-containing protein [Chitinophagaceae bacterium]|nr:T9SS type A sorting domain-containing protein [Chitinophagaceae bacterium]